MPTEPSKSDQRVAERRATKPVLESRTVLCAIIGMGLSITSMWLGYGPVGCEDQAALAELLLPLFTLLTSFGTFVFRVLATKMIS